MTLNHSIETVHYLSSDTDAFYQAGSSWVHRIPGMPVRAIAASKEDKKWIWHTEGEPQPYEDQTHYASRLLRKRFNHAIVNEYLDALGCNPNTEPFDLSNGVHHFWRTDDTPQIKREDYGHILERCSQQAGPADGLTAATDL